MTAASPSNPRRKGKSVATPQRLRNAVEAVIGPALTSGNHVTVLRNGDEIFPAMLAGIESAQHTIEFVTFVYWTGPVAEAMADAFASKARRGLLVRVLLDGFGSAKMQPDLLDSMRDAGVHIERFRPPVRWKFWESDHRTHRKILVCDNQVAFTGGVGIAEEWEGNARSPDEWRDTHFRIEGPAVKGLRAAFLSDWRAAGHPVRGEDVLVDPPRPGGDVDVAVVDASARISYNDAELVFEALVLAANQRVIIETPYFNPSDPLVDQLVAAHQRGVQIDIVVPGPHIDKRVSAMVASQRYSSLIANGISVWRYQPTMLHTKAVIVDGCAAFVGSVNVNMRSVQKDEEVGAVILDETVAAALEEHARDDVGSSELVTDPGEDEVGPMGRLAAGLLRPLRREF